GPRPEPRLARPFRSPGSFYQTRHQAALAEQTPQNFALHGGDDAGLRTYFLHQRSVFGNGRLENFPRHFHDRHFHDQLRAVYPGMGQLLLSPDYGPEHSPQRIPAFQSGPDVPLGFYPFFRYAT